MNREESKMTDSDPSEHFDQISEKDSKSIFKPKIVSLVLTQSEDKGPNIMTAAWWMFAGYNPFRYLLAVSHKTYTHEIIEENPEFVLAAPTTDMMDAFTLSGKVSKRELDKIEHLDIKTVPGSEVDVPLLKEAVGNVECTVIDSFEFKNCTYYFGGVEKAHVAPGMLDGRILSADANPLAYMGSDWGSEETKTKYRYYVDFDTDDIRAYPGDEVIESLPDDLRTKFNK